MCHPVIKINETEPPQAALMVPRQRTWGLADFREPNRTRGPEAPPGEVEQRLRSTIEMMKKHDNVEWWLRTWLRDKRI